jgi:hypothetical protein
MNEQQTIISASGMSPVRMLRMETTERDPYVFGMKDIRRLDGEAGTADGAMSDAPRAAESLRSVHIYELVNCTN